MSTPRERPGEPSVYARLAGQAEVRLGAQVPPRGTRVAGWIICAAVAVALVVAAVRVPV
jgi:hypothetical protein